MKKIIVLGAGRVGSAIALDLVKQHIVTAVDINTNLLNSLSGKNVKTKSFDLSDSTALKKEIKDFDLVISAVPGSMGYETLRAIIEAGKDCVDISFFEKDPFTLDELAKQNNVTAITDCGVAPGMSHIILGYYNKIMKVEEFSFYVGGLPFKRTYPFQYKAPFSPSDVIEIYTRPARVVENSKTVTKPAISDIELIDFEPIGTLEAFNSDGLRTLIKTMNIPDMKEKTLRYPGHVDYMQVLRNCGFFSEEEITIGKNKIRPVDVTSKLLFPIWHLNPGEDEFTIMRVIIKGKAGNQKKEIIYNLFDRYNEKTKTSSMARTTGYTCTAAANLILERKFQRKGICPPEYLGEDKNCFEFIISYLKEREVNYYLQEKNL
jgi:saccharopine dehydrogenase-like NADP-dependent oxidoreductase